MFTARVFEAAGLELLMLGGFGVSASAFGLPDVGLTTLTEMTEAVRRMCDRISVPLIADGDNGHGELQNVARTVRQFEAAGASGILLEDQVAPKRCGHFAGKQVIPVGEMEDKLRAALDARRDADFVIIARTDARAVEGFDAALDRAHRYAEVGVDMGFVEAPRSVEELARVARALPTPQLANMLPGGATPLLPASELETMGFKIVVDPVSSLALVARVMRRLADEWLGSGSVTALQAEMVDFGELKQLLGLDEFTRLDPPWRNPSWVAQTQLLLDSHARFVGRELLDRSGSAEEQARRLFAAPFVVVSHGTQDDPILNYGNRAALGLWKLDLPTLLRTPSRQTAEPVHQDERSRLLERTRRDGYVDDYQGVRIASDGRRFRIERATVWNLVDAEDKYAGQAATFDRWTWLD